MSTAIVAAEQAHPRAIPRALLEATGVALIGAGLIAIKALIH